MQAKCTRLVGELKRRVRISLHSSFCLEFWQIYTNILGSGSTVSKSRAIVKCTLGAGGVGAGGGIEEESEDFTLHSTFADRPTVLPRPPSAPEVVSPSLSSSTWLRAFAALCRWVCRFVEFVVL